MFKSIGFLTNKLYKKNKEKILCLLFILILNLDKSYKVNLPHI